MAIFSFEPCLRNAARFDHAREQRNRCRFPDRSAVAHHEADRSLHHFPHRCNSNSRQAPDRSGTRPAICGHVVLLGAQASCPEGCRSAVYKAWSPMPPIHAWRTPREDGRRAGTENVPYIIGIAKALELASDHREQDERKSKN